MGMNIRRQAGTDGRDLLSLRVFNLVDGVGYQREAHAVQVLQTNSRRQRQSRPKP